MAAEGQVNKLEGTERLSATWFIALTAFFARNEELANNFEISSYKWKVESGIEEIDRQHRMYILTEGMLQ